MLAGGAHVSRLCREALPKQNILLPLAPSFLRNTNFIELKPIDESKRENTFDSFRIRVAGPPSLHVGERCSDEILLPRTLYLPPLWKTKKKKTKMEEGTRTPPVRQFAAGESGRAAGQRE